MKKKKENGGKPAKLLELFVIELFLINTIGFLGNHADKHIRSLIPLREVSVASDKE